VFFFIEKLLYGGGGDGINPRLFSLTSVKNMPANGGMAKPKGSARSFTQRQVLYQP
jgi:hypothetical protein